MEHDLNLARWSKLMSELGLSEHPDAYAMLMTRYAEAHRHYHTQVHIAACLEVFDEVRSGAARPSIVEIALWFHDAIYEPMARDNERRSADMLREFLAMRGVEARICECAHALVMATVHDTEPQDPDARLLVDVDLSILGADSGIYDAFEKAIRLEYLKVDESLFRRKRREILQTFLDRASIYGTPALRRRFEAPARENLVRAIKALGG